jgi:hypothetical protein
VRTFFFAGDFLAQHGFRVDRRFGGLVRLLGAAGPPARQVPPQM